MKKSYSTMPYATNPQKVFTVEGSMNEQANKKLVVNCIIKILCLMQRVIPHLIKFKLFLFS